MNSETPLAANSKNLRVKIIGVGTAGSVIVDQLSRDEFGAATLAFVNTDSSNPSGPTKQILLDSQPVRGLGTGGDPVRGRELAEQNLTVLQNLVADSDIVFLIAGLGGGAGSGVTPVLARVAREAKALVVALVTLPFDCEGNRRSQQAQEALAELRANCDGVLCLPNQKTLALLDTKVSFRDTFRSATRLLTEGLRGVWRLSMQRGLIEIHFEELCSVLRERHGESYFATLEASGPERVAVLLAQVETHPLLGGGKVFTGAASLMISIFGGADLGMGEVDQLVQQLSQRAPNVRILMGAAVDEAFGDRLAVTVVVNRSETVVTPPAALVQTPVLTETPETAAAFGAELLHPTEAERPKSRLVPPAPAISMEQREQIIARGAPKSGRGKKQTAGPRMRQTTLPLDIVNKGRFDKSEPTIHKGEDLDLPTYVRRGVSLN